MNAPAIGLLSAAGLAIGLSGATIIGQSGGDAIDAHVRAAKAVFVDCTWEGVRGIANLTGAVVANASPLDMLTFTAGMAGALGITLADPDDLRREADADPGS